MPVGDAYAVAADYRTRVTKTDTGDDTVIDAQLKAVSRLIDRQSGRHFTQDSAVVARVFDADGGSRVYVDDIATATGLIVKVDLNGNYTYGDANETLAINTHFWLGSLNADKGSEPRPWTWLDLVPTNAVLSYWPRQRRAVEVTAQFGWPAVPGAIKEATITITRQIRDLEESGFTLSLQNIDAAIQQSPQSAMVLRDIVREYGRKSVFV